MSTQPDHRLPVFRQLMETFHVPFKYLNTDEYPNLNREIRQRKSRFTISTAAKIARAVWEMNEAHKEAPVQDFFYKLNQLINGEAPEPQTNFSQFQDSFLAWMFLGWDIDHYRYSWIRKAESAPSSNQSSQYQREIWDAVNTFRVKSYFDAKEHADRKIRHVMGALTERFRATSSWLFLKEDVRLSPYIDSHSSMDLTFSHNPDITKLTLTPGTGKKNGIVGFVAFTRQPYFCNDVTKDKHYWKSIKTTKSEMAVPIFVNGLGGGQQLIGVFNLESKIKQAFKFAEIGELMAAATELAPSILIWQHLKNFPNGFGWHPDAHGWTLDKLLTGICDVVSCKRTNWPRPACTIWHYDLRAPNSEQLHVRATSRFDHEYIFTRRLQKDSFTGIVAGLPRGLVGLGCPVKELSQKFRRQEKAKIMEMAYSFATPVHRPSQGDPGKAIGTVNFNFFHNDLATAQVKSPEEWFPLTSLVEVANLIGELISSVQELRRQVASAHIRFRLNQDAVAGITDFDVANNVILECLGAEGGSIFVLDESRLVCVATSGLTGEDGNSVVIDKATYDLANAADDGLTVHLARKNGQAVRRRSVNIYDPKAFPSDAPRPVNKFRESFASVETHRPFLGISVDDVKKESPLGVIRLVRNYHPKPFVEYDEKLLQELGRECSSAFLRWRQTKRETDEARLTRLGGRYPFVIRALKEGVSLGKWRTIDRLGRSFPATAIWNRHQLDEVLRDLVNIFRHPNQNNVSRGAFLAGLCLARPDATGLDVYGLHSLYSAEPPTENAETQQRVTLDTVGLRSIEFEMPITFDRASCENSKTFKFSPILRESKSIKTGLRMPVRSICQNGVFWGVLSLEHGDFALSDWKVEHIQIASLASKQFDFIGRNNRLPDDADYSKSTWQDAYYAFLDSLRSIGVIEAAIANKKSISPFSPPSANLLAASETLREGIIPGDADIECDVTEGRFRIPLWYGPFKSDMILYGRLNPDTCQAWQGDTKAIISTIANVTHLWSRFATASVGAGVQPLFELSFTPLETEHRGVIRWKPNLKCNIVETELR